MAGMDWCHYFNIQLFKYRNDAAGEAKDPEKAVKKAFKNSDSFCSIYYRYFSSLLWDGFDWSRCNKSFCYGHEDIPYADSILNFIVIVAAL